MARLVKKFETSKQYLPKPILTGDGLADVGIIAYGSTEPAVIEARDKLKEQGIEADFLRVRALPFVDEVKEFIDGKQRVYVVELNRDGQLFQIMRMDFPQVCGKLVSLPKHDGLPLSAKWVIDEIVANERK
jgi:2-oxoglutarate ferredoxin oxidoreductase subunit alpha